MFEYLNNSDGDDRYDDNGLLLHPIITSRPLTLLPSHSRSNRSSTAASAASSKTALAKPRTPAVKLQFINTAHPGESTTAKRISQIRSHVAKDSHARRRQRKAAQARSGTATAITGTTSSNWRDDGITSYSSASPSPPYLDADDAVRTDESYSTSASPDGLRPHQTWLSSTHTGSGHKGFRRIAPKGDAMVRRVASPGPRQMIGNTMKDAWNGQFAWELSLDDYATFNYCESICLTHLSKDACSSSSTTTTLQESPASSLHLPLCGSCRSCIAAEYMWSALWLLGHA